MKISSHARNILESVRFVIASGHWCQFASALDADGLPVNPKDASAISFDLGAAAYEAASALGYGTRKADRALDSMSDSGPITAVGIVANSLF